MSSNAGLLAAAWALGLTVEELTRQLWAGESLGRLAQTAGLELQAVEEAVVAATKAAARAAIAGGVTGGAITRAHARWLLEGLEAGYWGDARDGFALGPRSRQHGAAQRR